MRVGTRSLWGTIQLGRVPTENAAYHNGLLPVYALAIHACCMVLAVANSGEVNVILPNRCLQFGPVFHPPTVRTREMRYSVDLGTLKNGTQLNLSVA